jgi:hypothetical protein
VKAFSAMIPVSRILALGAALAEPKCNHLVVIRCKCKRLGLCGQGFALIVEKDDTTAYIVGGTL